MAGPCRHCGAEWKQRKVGSDPVQCPRCKRVDWNGPIRRLMNGQDEAGKIGIGATDSRRETVGGTISERVRLGDFKRIHGKLSSSSDTVPISKKQAVSDSFEGAEPISRGVLPDCTSCENLLQEVKGKYVCMTAGCGMQGIEQKVRRR